MDPLLQQQTPTYNPPQTPTDPNIHPALPLPPNPTETPTPNLQDQPPVPQYPLKKNLSSPYKPSERNYGYVPLTDCEDEPQKEVKGESNLNFEKMSELENELNTCFMKCYNGWLWVTIMICGMGIFNTIVSLIFFLEESDLPGLAKAGLLYALWAIVQSLFGIQAFSEKSLVLANVACWMMVIYLIPSILATIKLIDAIANIVPDKSDDAWHIWYIARDIYLIVAVMNTVFSIFVNLPGAFKVRRILSERNVLQEKIERTEDSIYV